MRRWLSLAAMLLVAMSQAGAAETADTLWSGRRGPFDVVWTTGNLEVRTEGRTVFSARAWADEERAHFLTVNGAAGERQPDCAFVKTLRLVALAGPYMSLDDSLEFTCRKEAHPGGLRRLITIDLTAQGPIAESGRNAIGVVDPSKPGRVALLDRLFPANDVLRALSEAQPLKDILGRDHLKPATLDALTDSLAGASGDGDDCFDVPSDLLSSFAFDRRDGDRLIVKLGLPGSGPCRMNLTTAELPLVPLPALRAALDSAAVAGGSVLLAPDFAAIARDRATVITWKTGRGARS